MFNQVFYICKTLEGWSYTEVLGMPEYEREMWYLKCVEFHQRQEDESKKSQSQSKSRRR